jgi:hypothetical protein
MLVPIAAPYQTRRALPPRLISSGGHFRQPVVLVSEHVDECRRTSRSRCGSVQLARDCGGDRDVAGGLRAFLTGHLQQSPGRSRAQRGGSGDGLDSCAASPVPGRGRVGGGGGRRGSDRPGVVALAHPVVVLGRGVFRRGVEDGSQESAESVLLTGSVLGAVAVRRARGRRRCPGGDPQSVWVRVGYGWSMRLRPGSATSPCSSPAAQRGPVWSAGSGVYRLAPTPEWGWP